MATRKPIRTPLRRPAKPAGDEIELIDESVVEVEAESGTRGGRSEKLHKMLAAIGLGSRRDMEALIEAGRVTLNAQTATVADRVRPRDIVRIDGRKVNLKWEKTLPRVLLYHKPEGQIVSRDDPQGRPSVFDFLPRIRGLRWIAVGRLDINTEGLLIFTSNGELANHLAHPRYEVEREYAVRILGELTETQRKQLMEGVELDDGVAKVENILHAGGEGANQWYHLTLMEGRNREVRRLIEAVGLTVSRLIRIRFGPIVLPGRLKRGMFMDLPDKEIRELLQWADLPVGKAPPKSRRPQDIERAAQPRRKRAADPDAHKPRLATSPKPAAKPRSHHADGVPRPGARVRKPR